MRQIITDNFGNVMLNNMKLPGIFESLDIDDGVNVDNENNTKSKQYNGYKGATITIKMRLLTDDTSTCYDKAKQLHGLFKSGGSPKVYSLVNRHAAARGITSIVFTQLRTSESNEDDTMTADITFDEHAPAIVNKSPSGTAQSDQYTVKKGDTMWGIARKYGVSLSALIKANPQIKNPDLIYPGQKINIPAKSGNSPAADDDKVR
ncbi:MAG: hypothetical protein PWQ93_1419 [Clostridiales bacterium]|jgi:spore coat assembly protein SafA|nr:hypothetical protein [Clostridiales bacterium]